jgi:hypothetical protein
MTNSNITKIGKILTYEPRSKIAEIMDTFMCMCVTQIIEFLRVLKYIYIYIYIYIYMAVINTEEESKK